VPPLSGAQPVRERASPSALAGPQRRLGASPVLFSRRRRSTLALSSASTFSPLHLFFLLFFHEHPIPEPPCPL
jgi:hypothetical protein